MSKNSALTLLGLTPLQIKAARHLQAKLATQADRKLFEELLQDITDSVATSVIAKLEMAKVGMSVTSQPAPPSNDSKIGFRNRA